jgi:hypothetical protein
VNLHGTLSTFTDMIYFNRTLKVVFLMKLSRPDDTEEKANEVLTETLSRIPFLQIQEVEQDVSFFKDGNDRVPAGDKCADRLFRRDAIGPHCPLSAGYGIRR